MKTTHFSAAAAVVVASALLTGCGDASGRADSAPTTSSDYGTRTVTDCTGNTSTFTAPPERVATVTTSVLEFLIALGLDESIVGVQAVAPGAFPDDLQVVADAFPKLGGEYVPGNFVPVQREQLLTVEPDLVIGGWPSNFDSTKGALSQEELAERDIPSYFALSASCARTEPITDLDVVYEDIANYGEIFDVEDDAAAMIAQMKDTVADVRDKVADRPTPTVFAYSWEDGAGNAYSMGNQHLGNAIVQQAGGENIFADVDAVFGSAGWEEVVARDPDVIILEVFGKATQEEFDAVVATAEEFFINDPALQNITAVKNRAFVPVIDETFYVGGVRNADAVERIAAALHPDAF